MPALTSAAASAGSTRLAGALAVLRSIRCPLETSPTMARLPPPGQAPSGTGLPICRACPPNPSHTQALGLPSPHRAGKVRPLFCRRRAIMSLPQAPGRKNVIERTLEAGLFASRWLMAPFYVGLALTLAVVVVNFARAF